MIPEGPVLETPIEFDEGEIAPKASHAPPSCESEETQSPDLFAQQYAEVVQARETSPELEADDPVKAMHMANANNDPTDEQFNAMCAAGYGSIPVFLYGALTYPDAIASVITDKHEVRTYEQARRMMPATLLDHQVVIHEDASRGLGAKSCKGRHAAGMLLFSTTGRERVLLRRHKGVEFKLKEAKAEVIVAGNSTEIDVLVFA